jgi:hypothetical protein
MGKYSKFKDQLTKVQAEPDYQSKVNNKKDEIKKTLLDEGKTVTVRNLGIVYAQARAEKARLKQLESAQQVIIEATQQELIEMMEGQEFTTVKLDGGVSISIKDDVYSSVKDKPAFMNWISENDMEDLLSVNYQTMNSLVKIRLIDGQPVPAGIEPYFKQSISIRGANYDDEG